MLEFNNKLGYYKVGDQIFNNKVNALVYSTKTNLRPEWNFNKEILDRVRWVQEPEASLAALYTARAQQLRDQYDYLVLNYSGGSDSKNILDAFLLNSIHLDEILIRWPHKGTKNFYSPNKTDQSPENVLSEWDFTILPDLKELAAKHSNTKITLYDYTDDVVRAYKDIDWITSFNGDHLNPAMIGRYSINMNHHRTLLDKGLSIAHIHGIDKPRITLQNGKFYMYYLDLVANVSGIGFSEFYNRQNTVELFYWTPDMPEIVQKQSHVIVNFFKHNQNLLPIITGFGTYTSRTAYEMITRALIYPTWDNGRFQAAKPTKVFQCEYDAWFFKNFWQDRSSQVWQEGMAYLDANIDHKWFNKNCYSVSTSFVGFISPLYEISSCNDIVGSML